MIVNYNLNIFIMFVSVVCSMALGLSYCALHLFETHSRWNILFAISIKIQQPKQAFWKMLSPFVKGLGIEKRGNVCLSNRNYFQSLFYWTVSVALSNTRWTSRTNNNYNNNSFVSSSSSSLFFVLLLGWNLFLFVLSPPTIIIYFVLLKVNVTSSSFVWGEKWAHNHRCFTLHQLNHFYIFPLSFAFQTVFHHLCFFSVFFSFLIIAPQLNFSN